MGKRPQPNGREAVLQGTLKGYPLYAWRKRLQKKELVRSGLVDRTVGHLEQPSELALEPVLANGERLRLGDGVDAAALRTVLNVLRA